MSCEKVTVYRDITLEDFIEEFYGRIMTEELGEEVRCVANVRNNEENSRNPVIELQCHINKTHLKNEWDDIFGFQQRDRWHEYD